MSIWYWALIGAQVAGFLLLPVGLPGLWLMLGAGISYKLFANAGGPSWLAIGIASALIIVAEVLEFTLAARYTRKYGGSKRAGWGAAAGGLVGAIVGVPIPIVGSVVAAFLGSFLGALLAEYSLGRGHLDAGRSGWGALVGRVASTTVKTALGAVVAVILLVSAWPT
jgi:hypothetical protein